MNNRDSSVLRHMVSYCNEIDETTSRFGSTYVQFSSDKIYRNAVVMCILQIGELAGKLSEEFMSSHPEIPWRSIRAMRNVAAHAYGSIDVEAVWETVENDIPQLSAYCNNVLAND